jgi:hypothetical protein
MRLSQRRKEKVGNLFKFHAAARNIPTNAQLVKILEIL